MAKILELPCPQLFNQIYLNSWKQILARLDYLAGINLLKFKAFNQTQPDPDTLDLPFHTDTFERALVNYRCSW